MSNSLEKSFRTENLRRLAALKSTRVVVLGGGVNGCAVLRELALSGVPAVLLDSRDFCAGASSASTRMAHGGLRYLENREFSLVRESLRERDRLFRHAQHATAPLPILVPLEHRFRGSLAVMAGFLGLSRKRTPPNWFTMKLALVFYESMSRIETVLPRHRSKLDRQDLLDGINQRYSASVRYSDGRFLCPESLVFELLEEAVAAHPDAVALNHVRWQRTSDGALQVVDQNSRLEVCLYPEVVINATGAWLDDTNSKLGLSTSYVRPVHGAHLVLKHEELLRRLDGCACYFDDGQGRMLICCPLEKTLLLGTTEVESEVASARIVDASEINYLLAGLSQLFDDLSIGLEHIVAVTNGARPLRRSSADDPYDASRDHEVLVDAGVEQGCFKVLSLVGGKWTTFRLFAEMTCDHVFSSLAIERRVRTHNSDYPGTVGWSHLSVAQRRLPLFKRYGSIGIAVQAFCDAADDRALQCLPAYSEREVRWLICQRAVKNLSDLVLRRMSIALEGDASQPALVELAEIIRDEHGHSIRWRDEQVAACLDMPSIRFRASVEAPNELDGDIQSSGCPTEESSQVVVDTECQLNQMAGLPRLR